MKTENSNGTPVLVLPEAGLSQSREKGRIGLLIDALSVFENRIQFPEGGSAAYHADQVLKLKDQQMVFSDLSKHGAILPVDDFKAMYRIVLLQDRGTMQSLFSALAIARDHPAVLDRVTESINPVNKIDIGREVSR